MAKIFKLLSYRQKRLIAIFIILTLMLSFLEIVFFSFIQPIITFFSTGKFEINNFFLNWLPFLGSENPLKIILFFFIIFFSKTLVAISISFVRQKISNSIDKSLSNKLYSKYLSENYNFFLNSNSSKFISNIIVEVDKFSYRLIDSLTYLIVDVVIVLTISAYLLSNYFYPTLVLVFFIFNLFYFFYIFYKQKFKKVGIKKANADENKVSLLQKSFYSIQTLKLDSLEFFFKKKFEHEVNTAANSYFFMAFVSELPKNLMELIMMISGSLFLIVLYYYFEIDRNTILSILGLFVVAMFRILPSANRILLSFNSVKYFYKTIDNLNYIVDYQETNDLDLKIKKISNKLNFQNSLKIENLSFSYKYLNNEKKIFNNINLEIKKNCIVGISGPNGSGKSTFLNLLVGLLDPTEGRILIDQQDIRNVKKEYQGIIGYVTQKLYLTDDSILDNITIGKSDNELSKEDYSRFKKILRLVHLEKFVDQLKEKENTTIGEMGKKFSGGQQQKIGIARALFKNTEILIFDEANNNLDSESEKELFFSTILKRKLNQTIIIVTHNKDVLQNCDYSYLIKDQNIFLKEK